MLTELSNDDRVELERRAHRDLMNRARGGIIIYLVGWLALSSLVGASAACTNLLLRPEPH